ncbi:LacI family DNA-binding transcriptional regulator [Sinomonas sp. JGH33]|uniref:LacI family DNA-binding transcriptional regulator n=1 Tax=Sinomonas terricola TaxID=3110330 RepID=A0ABU5TC29_9MICC|nr:LacI family DNA-binding transcriptional regulator [Sinomonas sp. JGH33]MEA5457245.1 LacI family DNA-binding transcriptional regulator [Sinomonas sp. JGH33]
MMAKVGIRDVSKAAGVSVTTVSHALSDAHQSRVNPETRRHVQEVAARLGYAPNRLASGLRNQRSYLLGLVSDQIASTPFAGEMILGAQDAAYERGWLVMLVDSGGNPDLEERQVSTLLQHQVDGIVYAKMYHQQLTVPGGARGIPLVLLDAEDLDAKVSSVAPDEVLAARTAVKELLDAGHRRIGFINQNNEIPATSGRLEGYRSALAEAGIEYDADLVTYEVPDVSGGRDGALKLLRLPEPPTGLFCFRDPQALGAYEAAQSLGLGIPEDVSVTSVDDFEIISEGLWPGLTTVALPHYEMGRWAVSRLLDEIEDPEKARTPERLLFECPIVRRGSVAPPRASMPRDSDRKDPSRMNSATAAPTEGAA